MRNILLVVTVLAAGFIGCSQKKANKPEPNYTLEEDFSGMGMIHLKVGKARHENFKLYQEYVLSVGADSALVYPIDIPNAEVEFGNIFSQQVTQPKDKAIGLRAYPGLKVYKNGTKKFTLIFIGTDKAGNNVYTDTTNQEAVMEDNNNPCKPCFKAL